MANYEESLEPTVYSKEGVVFMVLVDHLSGEAMGEAMEELYGAGACNVQMIPGITKKNRPSYTVLIDCRADCQEAVEGIIIQTLGSGGWHRFKTCHRHLSSDVVLKEVVFTFNEQERCYRVAGKRFGNGDIRPEYDSVMAIKASVLDAFGYGIGYSTLYQKISSVLMDGVSPVINL